MRPEALERAPEHTRKGLLAMNAGKPLAQPNALQSVLDRFETGEPIQQIADSLGITRQAVYRALLQLPDWQLYQSAEALEDLDKAKAVFRDESIRDNGVVARAREQAKAAQWTLERTCRSIYGDKLTIASEINPQDRELLANASELLALFKEKVIEQEKPAIEDKGE